MIGGDTILYVTLDDYVKIEFADGITPFKCVLLISSDAGSRHQRDVCNWLVRSGCVYAITFGHECEVWHDKIDWAFIERFGDETVPDKKFMITTWHDDETLEDVFHFAKYAANHPDVELDKLVVIDIGKTGRESQMREIYSRI